MEKERLFKTGLGGAIVTAICCFTPLLPLLLGLVGLAVLIPYLDYVLFPLLFRFLGMAVMGWRRRHCGRPVGEKACKTEQR